VIPPSVSPIVVVIMYHLVPTPESFEIIFYEKNSRWYVEGRKPKFRPEAVFLGPPTSLSGSRPPSKSWYPSGSGRPPPFQKVGSYEGKIGDMESPQEIGDLTPSPSEKSGGGGY
jgi:hypothetical protein